jgi:O-antigen ligase
MSLLKFGNPVIFNDKVVPPRGLLEWLIQPWPVGWGYAMFAAVALAGLLVWRWRTAPPKWILLLPAAWFGWQVISATQSVQPRLSSATLAHFACCTGCFYLGLFALSRLRSLTPLWLGWMAGFACVLALGLDQHFGGLEETRRWFFLYQFPKLADPPSAEFLQKLHSDRVYSTLFYPNTLAGVILLVLPMMLGFLWRVGNVTRSVRIVLVAGLGMASLACLWWSGSKAGWLILLVVALAAFVRMPILPKVKAAVIGLMLFAGLAGFLAKYQGYFSRGATSAAARLDYWKAASQVIREHPVVGSGPGTFGVVYQQIKGPQSEMARLAHNDYLQQGSDSGVVGMLAYVGLWVGSMVLLYRSSCLMPGAFCVWLGLLGLGLQGFVEFGLFIPALAWPQYLFLGWLWGQDSDRQQPQPPLGSKHR